MNAQKLLEFLQELEQDGVDLSQVSVNYRHDDDSDVDVVRFVGEDLFDEETNSVLTSIVLQCNQSDDELKDKVSSREDYMLRFMYGFVTEFEKDLKKAYKEIPKKDRLITYEQYIVAQFSNLIEDERI
jgi:hypothetical protein